MLIWMDGVTKLDIIRNETIRGTMEVGEISKRLKGYGHLLRRGEGYVGKILVVVEAPGKTGR